MSCSDLLWAWSWKLVSLQSGMQFPWWTFLLLILGRWEEKIASWVVLLSKVNEICLGNETHQRDFYFQHSNYLPRWPKLGWQHVDHHRSFWTLFSRERLKKVNIVTSNRVDLHVIAYNNLYYRVLRFPLATVWIGHVCIIQTNRSQRNPSKKILKKSFKYQKMFFSHHISKYIFLVKFTYIPKVSKLS